MSQLPTTMRAVGYRQSLGVDDPQSLIDIELPVPQPGPRDLLVQVEAVAVNPVDYKIRRNADPGGTPRVLGWDAAGTVVAVGADVELFEVGDEVYYAGALDRPGANSHYHAVDERLAARKPASLSFTAWNCCVLLPGQSDRLVASAAVFGTSAFSADTTSTQSSAES